MTPLNKVLYFLKQYTMLFFITSLLVACSDENSTVKLTTNMGTIIVELNKSRAPITVDNFLTYVESGFYDDTLFHRIIPGFVIQGGGLDLQENEKPTLAAIVNESGNGLSNIQWTIAMAREEDPHTATSQFYFNIGDNERLDPSASGWGYAVFGQVVQGEDVLSAMSLVPTETNPKLDWPDFPVTDVILLKAELL